MSPTPRIYALVGVLMRVVAEVATTVNRPFTLRRRKRAKSLKFVIDDETASSSCIGGHFRKPQIRDGLVVIDLERQRQAQRRWCWAAIGSTLGQYYGTKLLSQTEIVAHLLHLDPDRIVDDATVRESANRVMRLDKALTLVDCYSHWSAGKPLLDRVRFEINLGRPLAARIEWNSGEGHYVIVHGYTLRGDEIVVGDSMHGDHVLPMGRFPAQYQFGGSWTETFWTKSPELGCPSSEPSSPPRTQI